jgi:hypothetical protein
MQRQASGRGRPIEPEKQEPCSVLARCTPTIFPLGVNTRKWTIRVAGAAVAAAAAVAATSRTARATAMPTPIEHRATTAP